MKKLKLVYDSDAEIPEGCAEFYEERDGKWHFVAIDGLKTDKDVAALKVAADKERKLRVEAQDKLKAFDKLQGMDPAELVGLADRVHELEGELEDARAAAGGAGKGEAAVKERIDAAVARATKVHERQLAKERSDHEETKKKLVEAEGRATGLDGRIRTSAIEAALTDAASKQKVLGEAIPDVLNYRSLFEAEEDPATPGRMLVRTKDGAGVTPGLDPASWLSDQKGQRPHWWPVSQGGGARGAGGNGVAGDNPFSKTAPNITEAMRIAKADPTKATALAKQAGHASVNEAAKWMAQHDAGGRASA